MILGKFTKTIKAIGNFGTDKQDQTDSFNRLIRLVNYANLLAFLSFIFYISLYSLLNVKLFLPVILTIIAFTPCFALSLLFTKKYHFLLGRMFFQIGITGSILACTGLFIGRTLGIHYFFLIFATMPIFIWSARFYGFTYSFFLINALCYIYIEFFPYPSPYLLDLHQYEYVRIVSLLLCIVTTLLIININQSQIQKNEDLLEEQKKELIRSNSTKDTLLSIIAHDLKNPLNTISGFSDMLYNNLQQYDEGKIKTLAGNINDASLRTNILLENLLEWAASQKGTMKFDPRRILLYECIESSVRNQMLAADKKKIKIRNQVNPLLFVVADQNMLQTVFRNLISNAIKFSWQESEIIILADTSDKWIEISVVDQGVGISAEMQEMIFSVSKERSSPSGTAGEKGTGLGLLLCKDFIEQHGGTISVESRKDKGSRFYFTLPVVYHS